MKRASFAVLLLAVALFGAILLYVNVLRDEAPAALGTEDLSTAVAGAGTAAATAPPAPSSEPAPPGAGSYDGRWTVTAESEFGYRVEEVLFGINATAAGRSNQIEGEMMIVGTRVESARFTVDVASIKSDDRRRDGQFTGDIMDTARFPEATFALTSPIELGAQPAPGEQITATATGDLTLHGVTRAVAFEVTAEAGAERIGVLGAIPIEFADYAIDNPSRAGITTEDHGLLEFVLVLVPA